MEKIINFFIVASNAMKISSSSDTVVNQNEVKILLMLYFIDGDLNAGLRETGIYEDNEFKNYFIPHELKIQL